MFEKFFREEKKQIKPEDQKLEQEMLVDKPVAPVMPRSIERNRPVFTGMEDHTISLKEAGELTRNFRKHAGTGAVKGKYFSRAAVEQILAQEDAAGIRYYYGEGNDGKAQMVIVGVDTFGRDIHDGFIYGNPLPAPRFTQEANPLNS